MISLKLHIFALFLLAAACAGSVGTKFFISVVTPEPIACEQVPGKGNTLKHVEPVNTGNHKGY